jgi:hypothetical protein
MQYQKIIEYWSGGVLGKIDDKITIFPLLHFSSTPMLLI